MQDGDKGTWEEMYWSTFDGLLVHIIKDYIVKVGQEARKLNEVPPANIAGGLGSKEAAIYGSSVKADQDLSKRPVRVSNKSRNPDPRLWKGWDQLWEAVCSFRLPGGLQDVNQLARCGRNRNNHVDSLRCVSWTQNSTRDQKAPSFLGRVRHRLVFRLWWYQARQPERGVGDPASAKTACGTPHPAQRTVLSGGPACRFL